MWYISSTKNNIKKEYIVMGMSASGIRALGTLATQVFQAGASVAETVTRKLVKETASLASQAAQNMGLIHTPEERIRLDLFKGAMQTALDNLPESADYYKTDSGKKGLIPGTRKNEVAQYIQNALNIGLD